MSAFNDYCIVCDQLCSASSVYCSDLCKLKDTNSTQASISTINTSPSVQPQAPQQQKQGQDLIGVSDVEKSRDLSPALIPLQYVSPLLSSTTHTPSGVSLDLDSDCLNLSSFDSTHGSKHQQQSLTDYYLSSTSLNYKKWLHSTKATISN